MSDTPSRPDLAAEVEDLRARLAEAEEVVRAIRSGGVDALVVPGGRGEQIYTLSGADRVYRQLIETMSEGAATVSADGVILYCNLRLAEMVQRPLDQVIGSALRTHLPPGDQPALGAILVQARTATRRREISLQAGDGRLVPAYLSASLLQVEGAEAVFCLVLTDLTEQKRHEHIVAEERLARLILEQAAEAIVVCDEQGRVIRASQAAQRLCDGSPLQRQYAEAFPLRTADAAAPFSIDPVLRGDTLRNVDVALDRQGQRFDLILSAGPLLSGPDILGCVVTLTDITQRKKLQAQFLQSQKMEGVGQLAGGIAHDFNNLLTVIINTTDLALGKVEGDDPLHADFVEVRRAAERAALLTRQLLAFSRKQVLQPEVLNLNAAIANMEKMLRRVLGEAIELVMAPAADLGSVKVDLGQIEQVIMNLAINARDAMSDGGGTLTIATGNAEPDEALAAERPSARAGPHVMLAISDTGVGMDEATRARAFEPFFTTKEVGKGTGLGLSTVYGIVTQSNGSVGVSSAPGKGTTIRIYLPRVEAVAHPAPPAPAVRPAQGTETILVVEDQAAVCRLAKRILQMAGYTVLTAGNGQEALALLGGEAGHIHLMVTDMVMPGMSGKELAKRVRSASPEIKILFTSGYTNDDLLVDGLLDASAPFLGKPYTGIQLSGKVREVLDA
jgi:PAS domain S-box-containing protein